MDKDRIKGKMEGLHRESGRIFRSGQRVRELLETRNIRTQAEDGEILQSFTTRATIPKSHVSLVITSIVSDEDDGAFDRFEEIAGQLETHDLDPSLLSMEEIFASILQPGEDDEIDIEEESALLAETQIVVSHSPLSVESLESVVETLAKVGGTAFIITHPHLTPIALLSWAGIDIFIRVERKVGDKIAHHASELTDRFFQMMIDKWDKFKEGKSSGTVTHPKGERRRKKRAGGAGQRSA